MEGGEGSPFLVMPDIESEAYLVQLWEDAGVVEPGGMSTTRLSWKEILAWLQVRKIKGELPLLAWEIDVVRLLSSEYSTENSLATAKDRPAPYTIVDEDQLDRVALGSKFKNVLSQFKKADNDRHVEEE